MFVILSIACSFAACNNDSESTPAEDTNTIKPVDSANKIISTDTAARMMDPTENNIKVLDTISRRPHQ